MSLQDVKLAAKGMWPSVLVDLDIPAEFLVNRHGPCPVCGGKDRFRFDDKTGNGDYFCSGCGAGDGFSLLAKYLCIQVGEAVKMVGNLLNVKGEAIQKVDRREEFRELFRGCDDAGHITDYLKKRGLKAAPPCLRYHPTVEGKPSMLAVISGPDGKAVGVHRTHFSESKVRKRTTSLAGTLPHGSAVRLYPAGKVLGIAEGIETAIAAHEMFKVPVWAVLSTSGMKNFVVPEGVDRLIIFGDTDQNFAGHAAAYSLAHKLACDDRVTCSIEMKFPVEGDWLDELNYVRKANGEA